MMPPIPPHYTTVHATLYFPFIPSCSRTQFILSLPFPTPLHVPRPNRHDPINAAHPIFLGYTPILPIRPIPAGLHYASGRSAQRKKRIVPSFNTVEKVTLDPSRKSGTQYAVPKKYPVPLHPPPARLPWLCRIFTPSDLTGAGIFRAGWGKTHIHTCAYREEL
jgi:hypothetical protein